MTHLYTILTGGTVLPGEGASPCTAIAWADEVVLAVGSDDEVRGISRGDSRLVDLRGSVVVPLDPDGIVRWPPGATLETGGRADLAILQEDPRLLGRDHEGTASPALALVRGGRLVDGALPGDHGHDHHEIDTRTSPPA